MSQTLSWTLRVVAIVFCVFSRAFFCSASYAQGEGYERSFPQSKAAIEKALKEMQSGGRLPVLDGFATPPAANYPLDRYKRGYYQAKFQVSEAPSGGSTVRVSVQVTAWYVDPVAAKSGYQSLPSNGRLEADLLDQLADQLAAATPPRATPSPSAPATAVAKPQKPPAVNPSAASAEPTISAPMPRLPEVGSGLSASVAESQEAPEKAGPETGSKPLEEKNGGRLETEVQSLEEILKNQAHPKNLVAVKKSGTPVVDSASLNAKTLFLASAHDEFEMLDFNRDWVHVRISGLSRGWIWRDSLEMPSSVPDTDAPPSPAALPAAAEVFHVAREETAPFPGDWAPLRGKNVKIVSVETVNENAKNVGPRLRLEFAKSVLDQDYAELEQKSQQLFGIVLIFDSADGGMIAATFPTLQQWKAGKLTDAALWHQCFFDPPEILGSASPSASE